MRAVSLVAIASVCRAHAQTAPAGMPTPPVVQTPIVLPAPGMVPMPAPAGMPSGMPSAPPPVAMAASPEPPSDPTSPHRTIPAPRVSSSRVRRVIADVSLDLLLTRDYREASDTDDDWKTRGVPELVLVRYFEKTVNGVRRTLEIAAVAGVVSGYDIHLYGRDGGKGAEPRALNPDLAEVEALTRRLVEQAASAPHRLAPADTGAGSAGAMPGMVPGMPGMVPGMPGMSPGAPAAPSDRAALNTPEDLGHTTYDLSYIQADRAIAVLKALGYSTVEFSQAAGDSQYERVYLPSTTTGRDLPVIVKMIDAPKTSLMDSPPSPPASAGYPAMGMPMGQIPAAGFGATGAVTKAVPDIGGTFLHQQTAGEPQQRLLILYDRSDPAAMERLYGVLHDEIDVPARQVVISALVLEVNTDRTHDLGIQFQGEGGKSAFAFQLDALGNQLPFTYTFDKSAQKAFTFSATLRALVEKGEAQILSNPSVLVLDGRQARIQIGQQIPVVNTTTTAAGVAQSVDYFPVGIVLNLRPRISEDGSEVTMQVETIVSAAPPKANPSDVYYAPTVDNRQVQTFVRVGDDTPFIIGGLISSQTTSNRSGLPLLSQIPLLGALFRSSTSTAQKREVIVVLTPHVVPKDDPSFSYVIPKDSKTFDSFGNVLFRNSYRIRSTDVFDLGFIHESAILKDLVRRIRQRADVDPAIRRQEPFASVLAGQAPGEEILVRRMLWEIVRKSGFGSKIDPKKILVFQPSGADPKSTDFELSFLDAALAKVTKERNALVLGFDAVNAGTPEHPFSQPKADLSYESVTVDTYEKRLVELNRRKPDGSPDRWSIVLSDAYTGTSRPLDTLRDVLVLKRVLALNSSMPLTVKSFSVGRQIIFPTESDVERSVHVVDDDAARLFFEVTEYYRAFEEEFNRVTREAQQRLRPR